MRDRLTKWGLWLRRRRQHIDGLLVGVVALALGMWGTMALAERRASPTSDEFWHALRGIAAVQAPDTRLNWPHPPLAQALAMLPVSLTKHVEFEKLRGFETGSMPSVAGSLFKTDYAMARPVLRAGRLMNAALASGLVVFLFVWLRRRFDETTAVVASLFYATCPIVLAHGGLVTNDWALGAATVLSLAALLSYLEQGGMWRLLRAGLAVSLLPVVKVSGLAVVALEAPIPIFYCLLRLGTYGRRPIARSLVELARDYALVSVCVLIAINAVYRFELTFLTPERLAAVLEPSFSPTKSRFNQIDVDRGVLAHWPESLPVPLPFTYLLSLELVGGKGDGGHAGMWFGRSLRAGSTLYFPFMLLAKTQALLLPTILIGFLLAPRGMLRGAGKWLLLVALGFLAIAMSKKINIGVRHVFPTLACLIVLAGRAGQVILERVARLSRKLACALAAGGAMALIGSVALAFPAFIGDFNVLIGNELGRRASSIGEDWGQDTGDLARELRKRGIKKVAYRGRHGYSDLELKSFGVRSAPLHCGRLPEGVAAVALHRAHWDRNRRCYRALGKREPDFAVNHNILVFLLQKRAKSAPPPPVEKSEASEASGGRPDEPGPDQLSEPGAED